MKYQVFPLILALLLLVALLPGCGLLRAADIAEDRIEDQIDRVEDQIEQNIENTPSADSADIGTEKAEQIALEHAGFTPDDVQGLRTEYEIDDRVPRYDVQFRVGAVEYEYEISAESGDILSFDVD